MCEIAQSVCDFAHIFRKMKQLFELFFSNHNHFTHFSNRTEFDPFNKI